MKLLIRTDASTRIGTGHVMRMIALGQAWQERGGSVTFACSECPEQLLDRLQLEGFGVVALAERSGSEGDASAIYELIESNRYTWCVLDGYHFCSDYYRRIKDSDARLLALDDYGHAEFDNVDLVLNQNIHAVSLYRKCGWPLAPESVLHGLSYALLRREFWAEPQVREQVQSARILVTFGGADPENATLRILNAFKRLDVPLRVTVLLGAANPHASSIDEAVREDPRVEVLTNIVNMAALYAEHDGVISATGCSCYEWLRYRMPGLTYVIAENQLPLVEDLGRVNGVIARLWISERSDMELLRDLEGLLDKLNSGVRPAHLVDGLGAQRVVERMMR